MIGILNLNKPQGVTSFSVVAAIKKICGEKHVGHAGTLDPNASGVLPVFLGRATRFIEYLMEVEKTYLAGIELGVSTDTYDADGKITGTSDISGLDIARIKSALENFQGRIDQTPPVYSALKQHGEPLYKLARAGISVTPASRVVTIHRIDLLEWSPPVLTIRVECSKGTYIRSLAHDLGEKLGCGAFLKSLVRESYGPFDLEGSVTSEALQEAANSGKIQDHLLGVDTILQHWPTVTLTPEETVKVINGIDIPLSTSNVQHQTSNVYCRAYNPDRSFLAVLKLDPATGLWHPEKVLT